MKLRILWLKVETKRKLNVRLHASEQVKEKEWHNQAVLTALMLQCECDEEKKTMYKTFIRAFEPNNRMRCVLCLLNEVNKCHHSIF